MFTQAASRFLTTAFAIFRAWRIEAQVTSTILNGFLRTTASVSRPIVHEAFSLTYFTCEQKANTQIEEVVDAWTLPVEKVVSAHMSMTHNSYSELESVLQMKIDLQDRLNNRLRHYVPHLLVVFVAVLFVHDVFGTHGFLAMHRKQQEIQKVKVDLDRLSKENSMLEQDVKNLKTDPHTIEKIAREELGQARPGEVIIKLPAPPPTDSQPVKP